MTSADFWEATPASSTRDTWVGTRDVGPLLDLRLAERVAEGWKPETPIALVVTNRGKRVNDLLHATGNFFMVASERFVAFLEEERAAGWVTAPVEIRYKNGDPLPGYRLMVTTGRCDRFLEDDDENDPLDPDVEIPTKPADPSVGWDGSDLFWHEAPSWGFVTTDRVKRAIEDAGLTGFVFERPHA